MSATVIRVLSAKGGSGATTIAASLAVLLAQLGHRTLLVDAETRTAGLTLLHLSAVLARQAASNRRLNGLRELSTEQPDGPPAFTELAPRLSLLPMAYTRGHAPRARRPIAATLERLVAQESRSWEYVVVDHGPIGSLQSERDHGSADHTVIVTECDAVSLASIELHRGPCGSADHPERTWLLPNRLTPTLGRAWRSLELPFSRLPAVPQDADVGVALAQRRVPVDLAEPNLFTVALMQILAALGELHLQPERAGGTTDADVLHEEICTRYGEIRTELESLRRRHVELAGELYHPSVLARRSFRLGLTAVQTTLLWLLSGWAVSAGANPAWRAVAYLLFVGGAVLGVSSWHLLKRRALAAVDTGDILLELEAIAERLTTLVEQRERWQTLCEQSAGREAGSVETDSAGGDHP